MTYWVKPSANVRRLRALACQVYARVKWDRPLWRYSLESLLNHVRRREQLSSRDRRWLWYRVTDLHKES